MKAFFVSVWQGCEDIKTMCAYDPLTKTVSNIETVEVDDEYEHLKEQYVELLDGTAIEDFTISDQ